MSKADKKRIEAIISRALSQGWTCSLTKSNHWRCVPPTKDADIVYTGSTPSDHRAVDNFLAEMRRNGLDAQHEDAPVVDLATVATDYNSDGSATRTCPYCNEAVRIDQGAYGLNPFDPSILNQHVNRCTSAAD
jgi:hypothetical protein